MCTEKVMVFSNYRPLKMEFHLNFKCQPPPSVTHPPNCPVIQQFYECVSPQAESNYSRTGGSSFSLWDSGLLFLSECLRKSCAGERRTLTFTLLNNSQLNLSFKTAGNWLTSSDQLPARPVLTSSQLYIV